MTIASKFKKVTIGVIALAVALGAYLYITAPKAQALESLDSIQSGDLIRGESFSAVYYMGADGFRYVFPSEKTYFTWYEDFDDVKFISDADLGTVQIGGNVTYRPGVQMVKIDTDPRTYAVAEGGTLRHVSTEQVAIDLYGNDWNTQIHDLPDGFFTNYTIGEPITTSAQYNPAEATAATISINQDKALEAPAEISVTDSGYSPIDVNIDAGDTVRFTNNGTANHSVTADDLSWGSGTLMPGQSYLQTFEESGAYGFFDSYDSANTGAVIVD